MKIAAIHLSLSLALCWLPARAAAQGALGQRVDELSRQIAAKMTAQQIRRSPCVQFYGQKIGRLNHARLTLNPPPPRGSIAA